MRLYTCEICNTDYVQKEDALKCEKEHCGKFKVKDFRINPHQKYPHKVELKFSDGTTHWYHL